MTHISWTDNWHYPVSRKNVIRISGYPHLSKIRLFMLYSILLNPRFHPFATHEPLKYPFLWGKVDLRKISEEPSVTNPWVGRTLRVPVDT